MGVSESADGSATERLMGCRAERLADRWSARFIVATNVAYAGILVAVSCRSGTSRIRCPTPISPSPRC